MKRRKRPQYYVYLQMRRDRPDRPEAKLIGCGGRFIHVKLGRKWAWLTETATGIRDKVPLKYWHSDILPHAMLVPPRGKVTLVRLQDSWTG